MSPFTPYPDAGRRNDPEITKKSRCTALFLMLCTDKGHEQSAARQRGDGRRVLQGMQFYQRKCGWHGKSLVMLVELHEFQISLLLLLSQGCPSLHQPFDLRRTLNHIIISKKLRKCYAEGGTDRFQRRKGRDSIPTKQILNGGLSQTGLTCQPVGCPAPCFHQCFNSRQNIQAITTFLSIFYCTER